MSWLHGKLFLQRWRRWLSERPGVGRDSFVCSGPLHGSSSPCTCVVRASAHGAGLEAGSRALLLCPAGFCRLLPTGSTCYWRSCGGSCQAHLPLSLKACSLPSNKIPGWVYAHWSWRKAGLQLTWLLSLCLNSPPPPFRGSMGWPVGCWCRLYWLRLPFLAGWRKISSVSLKCSQTRKHLHRNPEIVLSLFTFEPSSLFSSICPAFPCVPKLLVLRPPGLPLCWVASVIGSL